MKKQPQALHMGTTCREGALEMVSTKKCMLKFSIVIVVLSTFACVQYMRACLYPKPPLAVDQGATHWA